MLRMLGVVAAFLLAAVSTSSASGYDTPLTSAGSLATAGNGTEVVSQVPVVRPTRQRDPLRPLDALNDTSPAIAGLDLLFKRQACGTGSGTSPNRVVLLDTTDPQTSRLSQRDLLSEGDDVYSYRVLLWGERGAVLQKLLHAFQGRLLRIGESLQHRTGLRGAQPLLSQGSDRMRNPNMLRLQDLRLLYNGGPVLAL